MTTIRNDITQGPSKFELMLALFDRSHGTHRPIYFKIGGRRNVEVLVVVKGVEIEDGTGESWDFKGVARHADARRQCLGHYRTDTRKGWIEFLD